MEGQGSGAVRTRNGPPNSLTAEKLSFAGDPDVRTHPYIVERLMEDRYPYDATTPEDVARWKRGR